MDVLTVHKEIEHWTPDDQDRIAASLSVLRLKRDPMHAAALADRRDDRTPGSWLTRDALRRKLAQN
ncbi:MAG: hypothetical protein O3C57_01045 [Verrucomicrobia bacterium]|nr:hypothetical protein [Verrucomicrobiota bacterium]